jgi:hypothetical protein
MLIKFKYKINNLDFEISSIYRKKHIFKSEGYDVFHSVMC